MSAGGGGGDTAAPPCLALTGPGPCVSCCCWAFAHRLGGAALPSPPSHVPPSSPLPLSQGTTKASNAPNTPDLRLVGHEEEAVFPLAASDAAPFIASGGSDKMVG